MDHKECTKVLWLSKIFAFLKVFQFPPHCRSRAREEKIWQLFLKTQQYGNDNNANIWQNNYKNVPTTNMATILHKNNIATKWQPCCAYLELQQPDFQFPFGFFIFHNLGWCIMSCLVFSTMHSFFSSLTNTGRCAQFSTGQKNAFLCTV